VKEFFEVVKVDTSSNLKDLCFKVRVLLCLVCRIGFVERVLNKVLSRMIIPYSAINKKANSTLENSMLKPLTSSLSASAKSKGLRLVSARIMIVAGMEMLWLMDRRDPIGCINPVIETLFGPSRR
ncbi:Valine--tRNA ligase, partial [Trichinella spiralis]